MVLKYHLFINFFKKFDYNLSIYSIKVDRK